MAQHPARISVNGVLPAPVCAGGVCTITLNLGSLIYTDGNGYLASELDNFTLNVIQTGGTTNWLANFDLYNKTHDVVAGDETGLGHVYIRFKDAEQNYLNDIVDVHFDRTGCLGQGHKTPAGVLNDIIKEGATTYEVTQQTLTANIDVC